MYNARSTRYEAKQILLINFETLVYAQLQKNSRKSIQFLSGQWAFIQSLCV